jgi:hypothetical protein
MTLLLRLAASAPVLAMLMCGMLLAGSAALAKDPPSPEGMAYQITITTQKGDQSQDDRLVFSSKTVTCALLDGIKVPYTAHKKGKEYAFDGTFTDDEGNQVAISGAVDDTSKVSGTITSTPKGGKPIVLTFASRATR